ncbi:MAG: DUF3800 domain-containing protein [Proteobacteria bacterium]|nr:DUF3800 domain-containing protein [Pseudomonadota bacterium]
MPARQQFHIYIDETSKDDTYFGVGAILCEDKAAALLTGWIEEAIVRNRQLPTREIHWKSFKAGRDSEALYTEVGTSLIGFTQTDRRMSYSALLVESRHIIRDRNAENIDDIIAKFIFTLIFQAAKRPGGGVDYHVYIDSVDGEEFSDTRTLYALNNQYKSHFKRAEGPFKSVSHVQSEKHRLIQATDLLTGVIAYEMNGRHLVPNAAAHKKAVFKAILAKSRLQTFTVPTKMFPPQFQIWHFDFSKSTITRHRPITNPQLSLID